MEWDDLADQQSERYFAGWLHMLMRDMLGLPLRLAAKHIPDKQALEASSPLTGSHNICSIVTLEDGSKVVVRFPIMGRSRFRREKTDNELCMMQYVARKTHIPLPKVLGVGNWGLGPYSIMTFVEGPLLSACLQDSTTKSLRLDASDSVLANAYRGMADVLLELYQIPFPRIGNIRRVGDKWKLSRRPLTLNMNELVRVGNYPPKEFGEGSFGTASGYFQELANDQFRHLKYQRNNAVKDEHDCRKKYIARCLFRKLRIQSLADDEPFRLYCDDFRPSNVIVASESDLTIKAVIDWEFTYAAPVEFSRAAPWWLLFDSPETWESDLDKFLDRYKPRLELFLSVMKECEDERIRSGKMDESGRLSAHMAESMNNGVFWLCLAARKSFMFDDIYWKFLDQRFFGPLGTIEDRLPLLSQEERDELEGFVQEKMRQAKENRLDEHMAESEVMND